MVMASRTHSQAAQPASAICFGLNRQLDEQSLAIFLQRATSDALLETLIPRLDDAEVAELLDLLTRLMGKYLAEGEYHRLFLGG